MQITFSKKIPFIKYQYLFIGLSTLAVLLSLFLIWQKELNYGIDFKGGLKLTYHFDQILAEGQLERAFQESTLSASVQRLGVPEESRFTIKMKLENPADGAATIATVNEIIQKAAGEATFTLEGEETVGPKVGEELREKGQMAILFTLLAMMIYIWLRFDFFFAPGAFITLLHDVIIVMGFMAYFQKEFNLTILAALLTIVGYSINDTIIIYDRIREHAKNITEATIDTVVNTSINETLSRTIITSVTVLIVVMVLFFMGGGIIHDFAFCFIIGIIVGTYSTIFVSSPIYIFLYKKWPIISKKFGGKKK